MSRHARIHHPPRGLQIACAHLKRQSKHPLVHQFRPAPIHHPARGIQVACAHLKRQSTPGRVPCSPFSRHARVHHPPRGLQVACAHLKRQSTPGRVPCSPMSRHAPIHHPPRGILVASPSPLSPLPLSLDSTDCRASLAFDGAQGTATRGYAALQCHIAVMAAPSPPSPPLSLSLSLSLSPCWLQQCGVCTTDPSAGSPTETLSGLLLPLSEKVH